MQRITTLLLALMIGICSFSQTSSTPSCETRETKLLGSYGILSGAMTYNTYLTIGAITDCYVAKGYDDAKVKSLFDEQKTLLSNIIDDLDNLIKEKTLTDKDDIYYAQGMSNVLKGLKKQIDYFLDYTKDKTSARIATFESQRKKNWDNISKLLDIK